MRTWMAAITFLILPACLDMVGKPAQAQLMDGLKSATGVGGSSSGTTGTMGGLGSSMGGMGGMSMPSVGSASSGNVAGVLSYCVRNKYESGEGASSVRDSLVGKLGGDTNDSSQYKSGNQGLLQTGNGQNFSLGGGGLKAQMTQKVCDQVLKHAKSLI